MEAPAKLGFGQTCGSRVALTTTDGENETLLTSGENRSHLFLIFCLIETDNIFNASQGRQNLILQSHIISAVLAPSALKGAVSVFISTLISPWLSSLIKERL